MNPSEARADRRGRLSTSEAARRLLADRDRFHLGASTLKEWEVINARPARALPDLRRLMQRPSPFTE